MKGLRFHIDTQTCAYIQIDIYIYIYVYIYTYWRPGQAFAHYITFILLWNLETKNKKNTSTSFIGKPYLSNLDYIFVSEYA